MSVDAIEKRRTTKARVASAALIICGLGAAALYRSSMSNLTASDLQRDLNTFYDYDANYCYKSYPDMISRKMKLGTQKHHASVANPFHLTKDEGTLMIDNGRHEKSVRLDEPRLMNDDKPWELTFNIMFPHITDSHIGRHGGIFWGSANPVDDRISGHKRLQDGAKTTVIDWLDIARNRLRVYGVQTGAVMNEYLGKAPNVPSEWRIRFHGENNGKFTIFVDNRRVNTFIGRNFNEGDYFGFYAHDGSDMVISNLRLRRLDAHCASKV